MKSAGYVRVGLLMAIAVLSGALLITPSVAEEGAPKPKKAMVHGHYNQLDLSDEQREQIAAIQKEYAEKIRQIRAEEQQKIAAVLTPEQQQKLERMNAEMKEKHARAAAEKKANKPEKPQKKGD